MSLPALLKELPERHRKHLDPASPEPMRMMAAKGLAPLPPREMVMVLCGFCFDSNSKLVDASRGALAALPDKILVPSLGTDLPAAALGILVIILVERENLIEKIVLNRKTPDEALVRIAASASAEIVEILAGNQERCMRSKELVSEIRQNSALSVAGRAGLFDFLARSGIIYEEMPEFTGALARLGRLPDGEEAHVAFDGSFGAVDLLPDDLLGALEEGESVTKRVPILKLIATLTVAQKVVLALKGNKEARTILIRDRNKTVATSVLKNPRITEGEVVAAVQNRSISEEVVRLISNNRDYVNVYAVKLALVNNPKTPLATAMRFLPFLRKHDIKAVSNSRGISSALVNQAKRLLSQRR